MPSFLDEHKVYGANYKNPDYVEGADDNTKKYYTDPTAPEDRTFIIGDQETFDSIFKENTLEVDFDNEIVLLYIFSDAISKNKYIIDSISVQSGRVNIYFKLKFNLISHLMLTGILPYVNCLVVKMDKIDVENAEFTKVEGSSIL